MTVEFQLHPICEFFPQGTDSEIVAIAESIRRIGLQEPIVRYQGLILDGRNRHIACNKVGVEPKFVEYEGNDVSNYGLLQFVLSKNASRRHLSTSQRAMKADMLSKKQRGKSENPPIGGFTQVEAAKIMAVSEREIQRAAQLRREAPPELIAEVERGEKTIAAALEECQLSKQESAVHTDVSLTTTEPTETEDVTLESKTSVASDGTSEVPEESNSSSGDTTDHTSHDEEEQEEMTKHNAGKDSGDDTGSDVDEFEEHIDSMSREVDKMKFANSRFQTFWKETLALERHGKSEMEKLQEVLDTVEEHCTSLQTKIVAMKAELRPANNKTC